MKKPTNYDNISLNNYEELKAGGHKCVIKAAEEYTSASGKEMLKVSFDTAADDIQPEFFKKAYQSDTRQEKKWGGVWYVYVQSGDTFGDKNLKGLVTAVEESNKATAVWGDGFCDWLKGKKIGLVFRYEEYAKQDGSIGTSTKVAYCCSVDKAPDRKVPATKTLASDGSNGRLSGEPLNTWMNIPEGLEDEGLPFK